MQIQIQASPDSSSRTFTINVFSDLDLTDEVWNSLESDEQAATLQKFLDDLTEQPYWSLDSYEEK